MLEHLAFEQILFIDIETVSEKSDLEQLNASMRALWQQKGGWYAKKSGREWDDAVAGELYEEKAAIFAEFGRIVVISAGFLFQSEDGYAIRVKSFFDKDEKVLLQQFAQLLTKHYNDPKRHSICGHNIREFDIPYICRRMIINRLPIPDMINVVGKKPWETNHFLDTMTLWKFGDFKNFTSLNLLANILGVPTPKDDIDGSEVGRVYWKEKNLPRIAIYCEKDVVTTAQVLLRYLGKEQIPPERIFSVSQKIISDDEEE